MMARARTGLTRISASSSRSVLPAVMPIAVIASLLDRLAEADVFLERQPQALVDVDEFRRRLQEERVARPWQLDRQLQLDRAGACRHDDDPVRERDRLGEV